MKRWLAICAAVGLFARGVAAGSLLESRAHAQMYRTMCLAPFVEQGDQALRTMTLVAEGRTDSVYDLAEGDALLCSAAVKPEQRSSAMISCAARLKAFYERYPERKANLERRHPADAVRLGFVATP